MKAYSKYFLFLLTFCWSFIGNTEEIHFTKEEKEWIKNHPVIEFGYDNRWEPYEIYSFGQYGGILSEYIKIIEKKTGIKMKPIPNLTWDKSLKGLKDGSIKVVPSCVSTPQRKQLFELSNPYIHDPIVIVAPKDAPYFSTLDDLSGKSVSLTKGYYGIELIKSKFPKITIQQYESINDCLTSLINGESDAFIGKLNVITYYINHYGFDNIKIVGTTPFQDNGICFGINPEWKTFTSIVNKVLAQVSPEKKHQIREKWIAGEGREIYSATFFILISISFIIILILVYFWSRGLKRRLKRKKETERKLTNLLMKVKKSDEEKKVLLQEIHHRVKNNLQIVTSMLNLQANASHDEKIKQELKAATDRVASIGLIHKKMYQAIDPAVVDLKNYTKSLFKDICTHYPNAENVKVNINAIALDNIAYSITPLALILNELITNSLKYAFHSQKHPEIKIDFKMNNVDKTLELEYSDNGTWVESKNSDHFGTSMIEIFTEQMEGTYELTKEDYKTAYYFKFHGLKL